MHENQHYLMLLATSNTQINMILFTFYDQFYPNRKSYLSAIFFLSTILRNAFNYEILQQEKYWHSKCSPVLVVTEHTRDSNQ